MRIISGKFRSRKIYSNFNGSNCHKADFSGYRPTTDRARETLFNVLNNLIDFDEAVCLDLFAGSGAVGFELISRGAGSCDFVENSGKQLECIKKTAAFLNCEENVNIYNENTAAFLKRHHDKYYDIIFADPPYNYEHYNELLMNIRELKFGIFILEHSGESAGMILMNDYEIIHKKTGTTNFTILNSKEN